jgi:glutamine amidotransferase
MRSRRILILDYGIGNVRSMRNAIESAGGEPVLSRKREDFRNCDGLVLPGVGAFAKGMLNLAQFDLIGPIKAFAISGRPVLGVCLGMQMMMSRSFEFGVSEGLGFFPGDVELMSVEKTNKARLPHIGWAEVREPSVGRWSGTILDFGQNGARSFYFLHSFAAVPSEQRDALALAGNGSCEFVAAIQKGNVSGTQFHPEKSGPIGLALLSRFIELCRTA